MTLPAISLADRYVKRQGPILITGVQALVRLMLLQADRDRAGGLKTGGFVSGYRGSPLGTLDFAFASAADLIRARGIVVKPAVNEELAATAVAGSQQIESSPGARVDGVFALWYGKGPGLDRASDAIRHGNVQGSSRLGGVVLAVGDDHLAKSSTVVCYSDEVVAGLQVPLFYPADAAEIVTLGLHAFAMSRLTGSWTALKIITEVADATRAVSTDEAGIEIVLPDVAVPPIGLHNRWPELPLEQEMRQQAFRLPAVAAYIRANQLDRSLLKSPTSRIGVVAAGKSWLDLREALTLLGLDDARLRQLGIALYKPAVIWPLEGDGLTSFAAGLDQLIVVEEKAAFLERQIKSLLYGQANAPAVWGKSGPDGQILFPSVADLTPERIAAGLGAILGVTTRDAAVSHAAEHAEASLAEQARYALPPAIRKPFFCSGCPHNRSTVVPEGSRAMAGIGCHGLAALNRPRTGMVSQMGGEGIHWMGLSPFTDEAHMFANLGDGTYFHSGLLAVRQAVAANLNITYKLLYNSAVAMTGGQPVDGDLTVLQVVKQLRAEGVKTIVVSTDDPDRHDIVDLVGAGVARVEHRDDLDALQLELRQASGVSVIIYDQMCATEKRRLRKRSKLPDPAPRVFINELICEGCGDCSVKSNCLAVEPVDTAFGIKRRINQSACNKDYSCTTGFCPSFVTIEGGKPRKAEGVKDHAASATLPSPEITARAHQKIVVAGIGGTGVVTIGALLSMAGHASSRHVAVLDQVGMAQKGGAVTSHIHVADDAIHALRIPVGQADLVIVCDQIVGNMRDVIAAVAPGRTHVVANADVAITGDFTQNRNAIADGTMLARRLAERAEPELFVAFPFTRLAERLLGDAIGSNLMMIGLAYQKGWLTLDLEAFMGAVELNGVAIGLNRAAFNWGRQLVVDPQAVFAAAGLSHAAPPTLDDIVGNHATFLTAYQDKAYGERYRATISRVRAVEARVSTDGRLSEAVARSLFKLMAYKDEYEVARLYTDGSFAKAVAAQFEGEVKLSFHMAPPLLAKRDKVTGHLRKQRFGPWMMLGFRLLARLKKLRGTALDPFGYTAERRDERALIEEYEAVIDGLIETLVLDRIGLAVEIAALPMEIRGFGHVKKAAIDVYRKVLAEKLEAIQPRQAQ